ncbi:MAG: hypothetical protein DMG22_21535 [Acidobacteria bacterium]|nr:MAG: hypothetical protein DMG22_21535 [Acidobacteriota bacterium]
MTRPFGFGTGVALERDTIHFIDALRDSRASMHAGFYLRADRRRGDQSGEDNYGAEPQFARHGSPSFLN